MTATAIRYVMLTTATAGLWAVLGASPAGAGGHGNSICRQTTRAMARSCMHETREEGAATTALCLNLTDRDARADCRAERREAMHEARGECLDQREARDEVCDLLGQAAYDPEIDPGRFSSTITNPLAPFSIGARWTYQGDTADGLEEIVVEVLDETRDVMGIECRVIRDRVFVDGELVEDTVDWLAQDDEGNVWYFGEIARNYEDGEITDLDGSWEAGVDGAKPGLWMPAMPQTGLAYRQEWLPGEAEDVAVVETTDSSRDVPFATGDPVVQTRDFTALEPDGVELKFYVPGVGLVLEVTPGEDGEPDELVELIEFMP